MLEIILELSIYLFMHTTLAVKRYDKVLKFNNDYTYLYACIAIPSFSVPLVNAIFKVF